MPLNVVTKASDPRVSSRHVTRRELSPPVAQHTQRFVDDLDGYTAQTAAGFHGRPAEPQARTQRQSQGSPGPPKRSHDGPRARKLLSSHPVYQPATAAGFSGRSASPSGSSGSRSPSQGRWQDGGQVQRLGHEWATSASLRRVHGVDGSSKSAKEAATAAGYHGREVPQREARGRRGLAATAARRQLCSDAERRRRGGERNAFFVEHIHSILLKDDNCLPRQARDKF